jgi:hypothetical protein
MMMTAAPLVFAAGPLAGALAEAAKLAILGGTCVGVATAAMMVAFGIETDGSGRDG